MGTKLHHAGARITLGMLLSLLMAPMALPVHGEGILNASCTPGSRFVIKDYKDYPANRIGRGHDMAAFLRGKNASGIDQNYMMLVWTMDSGKGDGGISFWNCEQPSAWSMPTLRRHFPHRICARHTARRSPT
jgi:hypothetical protein